MYVGTNRLVGNVKGLEFWGRIKVSKLDIIGIMVTKPTKGTKAHVAFKESNTIA